jgi:phospholipid-transporting ATPase
MQTIKAISTTNGNPDMFPPLALIIIISAVKDLVEDIKRHNSDREENIKKVEVIDLKNGKISKRTWASLRVGDVVKVEFYF